MGGLLKDREVSLKDKLLKCYKDGIYLLYACSRAQTDLFEWVLKSVWNYTAQISLTLAAPAAPVPGKVQTCSAMPLSARNRDSIKIIQHNSAQ